MGFRVYGSWALFIRVPALGFRRLSFAAHQHRIRVYPGNACEVEGAKHPELAPSAHGRRHVERKEPGWPQSLSMRL